MAVAGPEYECIYADVGYQWESCWWWCLEQVYAVQVNRRWHYLPSAKCLPFGLITIPYVFVADDAFALKQNVMKLYPQHNLTEDKRIFNYRHSRARQISENLFGIIANEWHVIRSINLLPPESTVSLVMAILVLHNYLRKRISSKASYCPVGLVDMEDHNGGFVQRVWGQDSKSESLLPLSVSGHSASNNAKLMRETLKDYFFAEGTVDWQFNFC